MKSHKFALILIASSLGLLTACASSSNRPEPAPLPANVPLLAVKQAWSQRVGEIGAGFTPAVAGSIVVVASVDGTVASIDATTGRELWRANAGAGLATGAGTDGQTAAVITRAHELVVLAKGQVQWKAKLEAQAFTAPLVAGGRVFVVTADRSVSAFDAVNGFKLWKQSRQTDALVLQQSGTLFAMGDTLVAGLGARLVGFNPNNGSVRWESAIASPRGTNDVERLADIVGSVSRVGAVVCARAYQAAVTCLDTARGSTLWSKPANGFVGIQGDESAVYGVESDGRVLAWKRADGQQAWSSERLQYRSLTAPLVLGRSVVLGDNSGNVHLVSRENGSPLNRLSTDGSAIVAQPVVAGDALIAVTKAGGVFAFRPE